MGLRNFYSLAVVPVPIFLCTFLLANIQLAEGACDLTGCWDLYQTAQEALQLRDDFPGMSNDYTPSSQERRDRCIAVRTFHKCIKNISRNGCHGNLNFHSAEKGVEKQMKNNNCSNTGPIYKLPDHPPNLVNNPIAPTTCRYNKQNIKHKYCGVFGDPHIRTFYDDFQTCKVQGAWPLLDNDYLTVQVTNEHVGVSESASALSKLTIMVKRHEECASSHYLTYQAQSNYLPGTFDDGRSHLGPENSVQIIEHDPGRHVGIYLRYIDTVIIVRQIGQFLTFAIKMPEDIINSSVAEHPQLLQLCVQGCPKAQRIDYKKILAQSKDTTASQSTDKSQAMRRSDAEVKCRRVQVVDFYFDSCVFDLMTTGDMNFTISAYHALQDVMNLNPQSAKMHKNRTTLDEIDKEYASSSAHGLHFATNNYKNVPHRTVLCVLLTFVAMVISNWRTQS